MAKFKRGSKMLLYLVISHAIAVYFVYKMLLFLAHGLNFAVYKGVRPLLLLGVYVPLGIHIHGNTGTYCLACLKRKVRQCTV